MDPAHSNLETLFLNNVQRWLSEENEGHLQAMADLGIQIHQPIAKAFFDENGTLRSFTMFSKLNSNLNSININHNTSSEDEMGLLGTYLAIKQKEKQAPSQHFLRYLLNSGEDCIDGQAVNFLEQLFNWPNSEWANHTKIDKWFEHFLRNEPLSKQALYSLKRALLDPANMSISMVSAFHLLDEYLLAKQNYVSLIDDHLLRFQLEEAIPKNEKNKAMLGVRRI